MARHCGFLSLASLLLDEDFAVKVFEINRSGQGFLLTTDQLRAAIARIHAWVLIDDNRPLRL
jgi:hypothetical protein